MSTITDEFFYVVWRLVQCARGACFEAKVSVPGFKLRDFRLWNFALGKDELVQNGVDINLGMLRAGKVIVKIDRETFLRIVDVYSRKVEGSV